METYLKVFDNYNDAFSLMIQKNVACKKAGNSKDIYCLTSHPDDKLPYAVVDLYTAIEIGDIYVISYNGTWINNPFIKSTV